MKGRRRIAVAAGLAALAAFVAPEFGRYAAERRVGFATVAFRSVLERPSDARTTPNILGRGRAGSLGGAGPARPIRGRG